MTEPYAFDHDGVHVSYHRATVRTSLETSRIRQKLIAALGYEIGMDMPTLESENIDVYADCMARSKTDAPWWCHANMTGEQIKVAYDTFMDADADLYKAFNRAYVATLPPKKTEELTPQT